MVHHSTFWQHLVPQHLISRITGKLANCKIVSIKNNLIRIFIERYHVDMQLAEEPDYTKYPSFNAFFTRALKPGIRPITTETNAIACPADGAVSQQGRIMADRIFQAKEQDYSLESLLGGDANVAATFRDGYFSTVYLAPKDYHRLHMPLSGKLREMIYIPGKLFSVNQASAKHIPSLFARNERVVALFEGETGPFAMILVGAIIVASIETVWSGLVAPQRTRDIVRTSYTNSNIELKKGDEMGRFQLGSTVIMLFSGKTVRWENNINANSPVVMGQKLGEIQ
ncbi:MAG: phosphatidylserine decarboxylase [Gammaproteobacteria bacterium]|jgi:phosphatidylserine decarboxylase|nr:phosphatidylserine decarboxylase [Gammaproteobacteria bacterium]